MKLDKGYNREDRDRYASSLALAGVDLKAGGTKTISRYTSRERLPRPNSSESDDSRIPTLQSPSSPQEETMQNGNVKYGTSCPKEDQHQGKELISTTLALPIDTVFNLIFMNEQFMIDVYNIKKTYDVVYSPWSEQEGNKNRVVTYTMALQANLGPKASNVTEKQSIQSQSRPGEFYIIEYETFNSGIPYADNFYIFSHYCLTKEDENMTKFTVWGMVKYKKSVWGIMKSMIEKNTYSGMEALLTEIAAQVTIHGDNEANPKSTRRRKRPTDKARPTRLAPTPTQPQAPQEDKDGWGWWLPAVVLTSIAVLVAANMVLYGRLTSLEKRNTAYPITQNSPPSPRLPMAGSWEEVARILQRQDQLHRHQLDEWKDKLTHAVRTLAQVEGWMKEILANIPEQEELLRDALAQHTADAQQAWTAQQDTANTCSGQENMNVRPDVNQNESQKPA